MRQSSRDKQEGRKSTQKPIPAPRKAEWTKLEVCSVSDLVAGGACVQGLWPVSMRHLLEKGLPKGLTEKLGSMEAFTL